MSGCLNHLSEGFELRLSLRRRMLAHLDIEMSDREAARLYPDIRATLMACIACPNPQVCEGWLDQNRSGLPIFCQGREAFLRLESEAEPVREVARLSA